MINTIDEFIEEFKKHKDKTEWFLDRRFPAAPPKLIRGLGSYCDPLTVFYDPPLHNYVDVTDMGMEIDGGLVTIVSNAADQSLDELTKAVKTYPNSTARDTLALRMNLLDMLGLDDRSLEPPEEKS